MKVSTMMALVFAFNLATLGIDLIAFAVIMHIREELRE